MKYFLTEYRALGGQDYVSGRARYGCWLLARGWKHADEIADARGLGEKVIGGGYGWTPRRHALNELPSALLKLRHVKFHVKVHALCFLGNIATASKAATAREFFDDEVGLIHQYVHLRGYGKEKRVRLMAWIIKRATEIEARVPGWSVR